MIRQFPKSHDEQLSPNFHLREFHCRCKYPECQTTYVSQDLIEALQLLRNVVGHLDIVSGFRCTHHNADIGGAPKSTHLLGLAADVAARDYPLKQLPGAAEKISQFHDGGIGIYSLWVHLDCRGTRARWVLGTSED